MPDPGAVGFLLAVGGLLGVIIGSLWHVRALALRFAILLIVTGAVLAVGEWGAHLKVACAVFLLLTALHSRRLLLWRDVEAGTATALLVGGQHIALFLAATLVAAFLGHVLDWAAARFGDAAQPARSGRSSLVARPLPVGPASALSAIAIIWIL